MVMVTVKEYAKLHSVRPEAVRMKAASGGMESAVKIRNQWFINADEPYLDFRKKDNVKNRGIIKYDKEIK